jgi:hypothetical protein
VRRLVFGAIVAAALSAAAIARAETPLVASGDSFRLDGYSSFEFERMLSNEGNGDARGSFDADLFDIVVNWRGSDRLRVAADVTWEHGAASEDGRGNVAVEYAFAEYTVRDWARLRAGKMFTPFGIYNEIHTAKPAFLSVKEPWATNKNDKMGSPMRFYPRWGAGVALHGNGVAPFGIAWDYVVALTNGEQESTNPFEEDDNRQKAIQGRVRAHLFDQLELGVSAYRDSLTEPDAAGDPTSGRTAQLSYGAHAIWRSTFGPGFELEYVRGGLKPSPTAVDETGQPLRKTSGQGATAMAWWTLLDWLTPYARVEWLDPDGDVSNDRALLLLGGVNLRVGGGLVVKAELDKYDFQAANPKYDGGLGNYVELKAAVVVGF